MGLSTTRATLLLATSIFSQLIPTSRADRWGYGVNNGPDSESWGGICQSGTRQSPVDIRPSHVEYVEMDELSFVNYNKRGVVTVENTGHGVQVGGFGQWPQRDRPFIRGGELGKEGDERYFLAQFHLHWASAHEKGSEHTIGSLHYPMELHLVHVKEGLSLKEALRVPNGLAVVGIFALVGEGSDAQRAFVPSETIWMAQSANSRVSLSNYSVGVNLPANTENFYRYAGSLTTPGCNEAVVWTLLPEPIAISKSQYALLRTTHNSDDRPMAYNNRPVQPLNGRRIQYRLSYSNVKKLCSGSSDGSWFPAKLFGCRNSASHTEFLPILPVITLFLLYSLLAIFLP